VSHFNFVLIEAIKPAYSYLLSFIVLVCLKSAVSWSSKRWYSETWY